ncbi:MAG: DNA replication/repair protein RecF [Firmicutes bacterium]|nr:DNA replication/repair protein RecF [Bacillota bacterium]
MVVKRVIKMEIKNLKLTNFRNYEKLDVTFNDHLNLIHGNNGMGKTNLVEAICVLALTRSFRPIMDKNLIMKEKNVAKIEGIVKKEYVNNYKVLIEPQGKKVKVDNNKISKISDYISKINVVIFNPEDLKIIKDTPSIRRKNINIEISQISITYLQNLNNYNKILKQRNAYLKTMAINSNTSTDYLDVLTNKLVELGIKIYEERRNYYILINKYINNFYKKITGFNNLEVRYISDFDNKKDIELLDLYKKNLKKDLFIGKTSVGVHHDDLEFYLDDMNLKVYGSEGQQKNAIISLKLSEIEIIKEKKNDYPILVLDDLFSELDNIKINNIIRLLNNDVQTFITTTNIENVSKSLLNNCKVIRVSDGKIEEDSTYE